jgi:hypothetical protein
MTLTSSRPTGARTGSNPWRYFRRPAYHALADLVDVADTEDNQSMPIWMLAAASCRPGIGRSCPARHSRRRSRRSVLHQRLQAVVRWLSRIGCRVGDVGHLLVDDRLGEAELGDLAADRCRRREVGSKAPTVTERREVARDRQRGGAGADQGNSLAVAARQGGAGGGLCRPCSRRPRA